MAGKLFDAVETLTWRAANLQPDDLRGWAAPPSGCGRSAAELPGLLLEKGANLFMRNGQDADDQHPGRKELSAHGPPRRAVALPPLRSPRCPPT